MLILLGFVMAFMDYGCRSMLVSLLRSFYAPSSLWDRLEFFPRLSMLVEKMIFLLSFWYWEVESNSSLFSCIALLFFCFVCSFADAIYSWNFLSPFKLLYFLLIFYLFWSLKEKSNKHMIQSVILLEFLVLYAILHSSYLC